ARTVVTEVSGAELRAQSQCVFYGRSREQRGRGRSAEDIPTPRWIRLLGKHGGMNGWSGDARSADGIARKIGGPARSERHTQRRAPLTHRVRRDGERIGPELTDLVFVELDDIEAAEPAGGLGQGARDSSAVRLLCQEEAVQVDVDESREATPQQLRGLEVHLVPGYEIDVEGIEVMNERPELGPGPRGHA